MQISKALKGVAFKTWMEQLNILTVNIKEK